MRFILALLVAAFALLLVSEPAAAQCPPGWGKDKRDGSCIVPGYRSCGVGKSCAPGSKCQRGQCVGGVAAVNCGNYTCGRGEGCGPTGGCYNLRHQFICGSYTCMVGYNYAPGDSCAPCMGAARSSGQDDMTVCKSASTAETADRNIAACTRVINDPRTSRRTLPSVYQARCVEWATKRDFNRAIADCNQALSLSPDYHAAYNARGSAYEGLGDINQAIADYRRAASFGLEEARQNLVRLRAN